MRYDQGLTSWEIPYAVKNESSNMFEFTNEIERSLCLLGGNTTAVHNGVVVISTSNPSNISFEIEIRENLGDDIARLA